MNVPLYVVSIAMIGCGLPLFLFTYTLQAVSFHADRCAAAFRLMSSNCDQHGHAIT